MADDSRHVTKEHLSDVRLCVTGGSGVGKSAITVRFLTRRFIGEYQRDVEQSYKGVINFGARAITYVLTDTATSPDKAFLATWPTCVAVVYSISDITSFGNASQLLDDIDSELHQALNCKTCVPSIALIGNKNDLEHIRGVSEDDARQLAAKHGATFWEVSASVDYHSVFRPLYSLIVESFLSGAGGTSPPSSHSPVLEDRMKAEEFLGVTRRKSEPFTDGLTFLLPPEMENSDSCRPVSNPIKRRRKFRENRSKSLDRGILMPSEVSTSAAWTSTPAKEEVDGVNCPYNIRIEVTESSDPHTRLHRSAAHSQSFSKGDKKRVQRKILDMKKQHSLMNEIKSRSLSDLKTLEPPNAEEACTNVPAASSDMFLTVEGDAISKLKHHLGDGERLCDGNHEHEIKKKSVRRKISSIFLRPRSHSGASN